MAARRPTTATRRRAASSSGSTGVPSTGSLRSSTTDLVAASRASARCASQASTSARGRAGRDRREAQQRGHRVPHRRGDVGLVRLALGQRLVEPTGTDHAVGHLDVEAGRHRRPGVAQPEDPVGDHHAGEAPLVAQHLGEQLAGSGRTTRR